MVKGRALSELLRIAEAPLEEARLAGKASVLAGRRLGLMLRDLDAKPRQQRGSGTGRQGPTKSERSEVVRELGLSVTTAGTLTKLAMPRNDPLFQQYIQLRDKIPSIHGAAIYCSLKPGSKAGKNANGWEAARKRKRAGVKMASDPSLDEAYSLIVKALGHLDPLVRSGHGKRSRAISTAMDALYEAEDALKPFRGGYA